jgi:hypothetical protein
MLRCIFIFFSVSAIAWWWLGPSPDELVVYPASCQDGRPILPFSLARKIGSSAAQIQEHEKDRVSCVIVPKQRWVYRLNTARGEVYYNDHYGTRRLVDCAIFSRTEWTCSYPNRNNKVTIIDGRPAIAENDAQFEFYVDRWQWWAATLYGLFGRPQGRWLIPAQREAIN